MRTRGVRNQSAAYCSAGKEGRIPGRRPVNVCTKTRSINANHEGSRAYSAYNHVICATSYLYAVGTDAQYTWRKSATR